LLCLFKRTGEGEFLAGGCMNKKKLAICVPYRDRKEHLDIFVPYITSYLSKKGIDHKVFICNQTDKKEFNRGKIKNIAFDIARKEGYDYFAFHDIDLIPEDTDCDYSYPEKYPVLISTDVEKFNFQLPTIDFFGSCVLFTKEQFEKVNGYYNDYWGWGEEDDDLFWRCRAKGLANREKLKMEMKKKSVLHFNGINSYIKIKQSSAIDNLTRSSFSMLFLTKVDFRKDFPVHLFSKPDDPLCEVPIICKDNIDFISYSNTTAFSGILTENSNEYHELWKKRYQEQWTWILLSVDTDKKKISFFLNGDEPGKYNEECLKSPSFYKNEVFGYSSSPIFIGARMDTLQHDPLKLNLQFFKGDIAHICFWSRAFSANEVNELFNSKEFIIPSKNLILNYDFSKIENNSVIDMSGNKNHGQIFNGHVDIQNIGPIYKTAVPHRRKARFKSLIHKPEGYNFNYNYSENTYKNEVFFKNQVQRGLFNTDSNGLNNLAYKLVGKETIYKQHSIINVEC